MHIVSTGFSVSGAICGVNLVEITNLVGVVMKRAIYFILCNGKMMYDFLKIDEDYITRNLLENDKNVMEAFGEKVTYKQLTLFEDLL